VHELQAIWQKIAPESAFTLTNLSSRYELLYVSESRLGNIAGVFAGLSIFVACLGLFGLCAYLIMQRTKEIGIRKALGASVRQIFSKVSVGFLKPVAIAFIISAVLSNYIVNLWLEDFNYRINFSWSVVIIADAGTMFVAIATVFYHAFQIATLNPVTALKEN
jgi:putative ABC transport system permease protein